MNGLSKFSSLGVPLLFALDKLFRRQAPTSREVSRELHKILGDKPFELPEWLNFDLKALLNITRDPMAVIIIILSFLGLYLLFYSLRPYLRLESAHPGPDSKMMSKESKSTSNNVAKLFEQSLNQAGNGEYGRAIISLHKATVEYLTTKKITSSTGKKYSNNDLKRILKKNSNLYQPFAIIARYAEIAGFSSIKLSQSEFDKTLETFKESFLK